MKQILIALALVATSAAAQLPPDGVIRAGETVVIGPGMEAHHTGPIFVSGGRLEVTGGKLFLNGTLWIVHDGTVVFDRAEFHHEGEDTHVLVGGIDERAGKGSLALRNGSRLHFVQSYVSQHELQARNGSEIRVEATRIDCDAATGVVRLFDTASYAAVASTAAADQALGFPGCWMTTYMNGSSSALFESMNVAGDIVFYDAARILARKSYLVMPWLYFPGGAVGDLSFPASPCDAASCPPVSKTIDSTSVAGIDWSVVIDQSYGVAWGINSYPGSHVTVRDSALTMAMVRLGGTETYFVPGDFRNDTYYPDKIFSSLPDRDLELVNTSVKWWKVDVIDYAQARIDNIVFAEMMVKNGARAFVTNSICEGQTIHLGAIDNGYVYFKDGEVWTHVSAWSQALMVLDGSLVDYRKAPIAHQMRNIAHNRARLYALNSELISPPEAMESALVTFARLGNFEERELRTTTGTWTPLAGSAWIVKGPASAVDFDRWILAIRPVGASSWTNFASGTTEVRDGMLAMLWPGLIAKPGEYELRLSILVRGDDPATPHPTWAFPAIKKLVVQ